MTKFVTQNGNNLFRFTLLHQSVIDDNVLLPGKAEKVGITVCASLAPINRVNVVQRELQVRSKLLHTSLDLARFERGQLVKQRQNNDRIDSDSKDLYQDAEQPEVVRIDFQSFE